MPLELQIPIVTQEDLRTFHAKHFGVSDPRSSAQDDASNECAGDTEVHYEEDDDDGLGYYPDGRKRTLTDEQIAMFRHSEIYAIIRERQIRKENEEADGLGGTSSTNVSESGANDEEGVEDAALSSITRSKAELQQSGESTENLGDCTIQRERLKVPKNSQGGSSTSKRKRSSFEPEDEHGRDVPSRRRIRELDSADVTNVELNYGDENNESSEANMQPSPPALPKGRKIWWPVLE